MNTVRLEVRSFDEVLGDVAKAWKTGEVTKARISFDSVEDLWKERSPKKMDIPRAMTGAGQLGIREVSRKVVFPYDEIHVDFTLRGVA